jgi:polyisoprenoid-binding protein YceI
MRLIPVFAPLLLAVGAVVAAPVHYDIDPNHTQVVFSWNHFCFSHPAGRFDKVQGDFNLDASDPTRSTISVEIPISSIDTGVAALDEHLQGPDFFDAAKFPIANFKSTHVERIGAQGLKVSGNLTIHGVTRPAVLDVTINKIGEHPMGGAAAGFDARTTIKRSDFGITKYVPDVSDDIIVSITTEAHLPQPTAGAK